MKNINSYKALEEFKDELLMNNFIDLPDQPTSTDLAPFEVISLKHFPLLYKALLSDLSLAGIHEVELLQTQFIPEDIYAQGATIYYIYVNILIKDTKIAVAFKYIVFQNIIHCYLYGQTDNSSTLGNNNIKIISELSNNYITNKTSHLHQLLYL